MNKRAKIIIAIILALLILLVLWYMRPRTFDAVIDLDGKTITDITVTGMFVEDSWDAEGVYWPVHKTLTIRDADADAVQELLRTSRYRYTLRSLLSPDSVSLDVDLDDDGRGIVIVTMVLDGKEYVNINVSSSGPVTFSLPGEDGIVATRPNSKLSPALSGYVRANGVEE